MRSLAASTPRTRRRSGKGGLASLGVLRQFFFVPLEGESTWRYSGKARYGQVDAAIIDFRFTDVLTPALGDLDRGGASAPAKPPEKRLNVRVLGRGQGRLLVALDDGRMLQNHANAHHSLKATLNALPGASLPPSDPVTVEITSQTTLQMEGTK